jgi:Flp pilus assembly protein TadG
LKLTQTDTRRLLDTRGQVLVVFVLFLVVLVGMAAVAIDVGNVYLHQAKLQAAVDAGALAGARDLEQGDAASQAQTVADQLATTNVADGSYTATASGVQVSMTGKETVPTFLAGLFGIKDWHITVNATANYLPLYGASGIMPFAVTQNTINSATPGSGTQVALTVNSESAGNWGYLALNGTGASVLDNNIMYGATGNFYVGESLATKTGKNVGPVSSAIDYRINEDSSISGCGSYTTAQGGCPGVVTVPIVEGFGNGTSSPVTVLGFAEFYLAGYDNGAVGYFITTLTNGSGSTKAPKDGGYALGLAP